MHCFNFVEPGAPRFQDRMAPARRCRLTATAQPIVRIEAANPVLPIKVAMAAPVSGIYKMGFLSRPEVGWVRLGRCQLAGGPVFICSDFAH